MIAANLLQIPVTQVQMPTGIGELRERFPVPILGIFILGKAFFDGIDDLGLSVSLGFVLGVFFCPI